MSFLQLLLLLRRLPFRDLLDYPDNLEDVESVRLWLLAVTEAGEVLANLTDTSIDDDIVDALAEVLTNKEAFNVVYGLIIDLFHGKIFENDKEFKDGCVEASDHTCFSPTMIIAIIQVVIMLLKFIRERRDR